MFVKQIQHVKGIVNPEQNILSSLYSPQTCMTLFPFFFLEQKLHKIHIRYKLHTKLQLILVTTAVNNGFGIT